MMELLFTLALAVLTLLIKRWIESITKKTEEQTADIGTLMATKLEPVQASIVDTHRHIGQLRNEFIEDRRVRKDEMLKVVDKVDAVVADVDLLKTKVAVLETAGGMRAADKEKLEELYPKAEKA
jgi:hypothetical protein